MAHQSLFRQYRPQRFDQVYGQEQVTRTLRNALAMGRVAQAYLFCGPRGVGKTTVARLLAKALNCDHGPTPDPCGECESCRRIAAGSTLSVIEIDAASNRRIEDIRALREDVQFAPSDGRRKVYILDEAHQITPAAFEAFLKTLEEPPAHALFVLATTEANKIPATIVSRCQRLDFRRVGLDEIVARLVEVAQAEQFAVDESALWAIARAADGSLRDALGLLDQIVAFAGDSITAEHVDAVLGTLDAETRLALGRTLAERDAPGALAWLNGLLDAGRDARLLVDQAIGHFRLLLLARLGVAPESLKALSAEAREQVVEQAQHFSPERLMAIVEGFAQADKALRWHGQPRILLEVTLLELALELDRPALTAAALRAPERPEREVSQRPGTPRLDDTAPGETPASRSVPSTRPAPGSASSAGQGDWWTQVTELLRRESRSLAAHATVATARRTPEGAVTLYFGDQSLSYDHCRQESARTRLEAAVHSLLGADTRVFLEVGPAPEVAPPTPAVGPEALSDQAAASPAEAAGSPAQPGLSLDDVAALVQATFPGAQMDPVD